MAEQQYPAEIQELAQRFPGYSLEELDVAAQESRFGPYGLASPTDFVRKLQRNRTAIDNDIRSKIQEDINALEPGTKQRKFLEDFLAMLEGSAGGISAGLDKMSKEASQTARRYIAISRRLQNSIRSTTISAVTGIQAFQEQVETAIFESINIPTQLADVARPVSSALGSTFNTATAILKDPLGAPQYVANALTPLLDKINPNIVNSLDAASKTIGLSNLAHLPSKMMGSLRNLATAADAILSMPFELLADMYNGLLEIMEAIADLIDGIVSAVINLVQKLIYQILDSILPLSEIMTFLETIGEIAGAIGGIASMLGGFNVLTNITSQVTNFASLGTDILNSPLQMALQYIPGANNIVDQGFGAIGSVTDALRDPEQFIGNLLPLELSNQLSKISQIPGLGFVGNLGYSVGDTLDTLSDGIFTNISKQFENQLPQIAPLFNKKTEPSPYEFAQEPHGEGVQDGRNGQPVHQNGTVPVIHDPTFKILPELGTETQQASQRLGEIEQKINDKAGNFIPSTSLDSSSFSPTTIKL